MDTLEEARAEARRDGRIVVADFFTVWCGPCRQLDNVTWPDPRVQAWLKAKAVFVKIDAELEPALAERMRITAFPTILLLRADGGELDRLVGYRTGEAFIKEADSALAGKDSLARAREAAARGGEDEVTTRYRLGQAAAEKGLAAEALAEFLWCFDNGGEKDPAFAGVRLSYLLDDIARLGRTFPPALEALRLRRDRAEGRLASDAQDGDAAFEAARLNAALSDERRTAALFDKASEGEARRVLAYAALDLLLADGRYTDAAAGLGDPAGLFEVELESYRRASAKNPDDDYFLAFLRQDAVDLARKLIQTLRGAGREAEAVAMEARLKGLQP